MSEMEDEDAIHAEREEDDWADGSAGQHDQEEGEGARPSARVLYDLLDLSPKDRWTYDEEQVKPFPSLECRNRLLGTNVKLIYLFHCFAGGGRCEATSPGSTEAGGSTVAVVLAGASASSSE
jgi:hypothetical protein